jgi:hypothetical protein
MRPHQNKTKMIAGLVSAAGAAVLALCLLTAGAVAAPNPGPGSDGPQSANVPYVAWVGEHVRLVVCDKSIASRGDEGQFVNYQVEDWSGYQFQPPTPDGDSGSSIGQAFDPGPAAFFRSSEPAHRVGVGENQEQEGCVATDYKSLNPGLTRIRVVVRKNGTGAIVFSHQFLAIWLTVNKPILSEAGTASSGTETFQSQLNGTGQGNLASFLGDPAGDGKFIPSPFSDPSGPTDKGLVQIRVTGSFPVVKESPLSNILSKSSYTLPSDWATLAETLASSSEETEPPGTNPGLWDIHGTPSNGSTSNTSSGSALFDTFSRPAFSDFTSGVTATVGPFDPQAANETLLSDGQLNVDDAPMPAMRIDMSIAANKGGSDLGGVGQISGASKALIYSHDFTGTPNEGNLYNPYYGAYIPATDRPEVNEVSGIDGPSPGGDFPGFLNNHSKPYTFWESVLSSNNRSSGSTGCLRREGAQPSEFQTPGGPRTETFYTDERGEAYVTYTPGDGFFLENLPLLKEGEAEAPGKVIKNGDGGCDLKLLKGSVIGESSISAKAVYPYEPVDYSAQTSEGPLTKTVMSEWEKEWFQFSKGPGANENTVKIIVAKAQDIDGHPFVGEAVCFVTPNGGTVSHFPGNTVNDAGNVLGFGAGNVVVGPSTIVFPPGKEGKLCETTNSNGLAAIEVTNSTLKHVDLNVEYVEENILRDHEVNFVTAAEEKAEKEAAEKKEAEEDTAAEVKIHEEEAKNKEAREANEEAAEDAREEAAAAEKTKLAEEVTKKEKTEAEAKAKEEATKKANEEAAKAEKEANEKAAEAEKKANEEKISTLAKVGPTTTTTTTGSPAPQLYAPAPAPSLVAVGGVKGSKSHRAHAAKHKKHKKSKKSKKSKKK